MPVRVLYLHHVEQLAGAENSLLLLFRHVDRDRVHPIFAGPAAGPFPRAVTREGIPAYPVAFGRLRNVRRLIVSLSRVRRLIREHRIDLLHSNGPQTNVCAGLSGRLTGVPAVWHMRNLVHDDPCDVDRLCAGLATRIICNSDAIRERFRGTGAWSKAVTILNAIDPATFNPQVPRDPFRREQGLSPSDIAVGIVGRIGHIKGHEHFVAAAMQLVRAGLHARFFIVGEALFPDDAGHAERLRSQVKEAGLDDHIQFTGHREDIPSVMRGLDIVVLTSDAEGCSRVVIEAMASGTAIVATSGGGTPEVIRDGLEGLLVPPRDPRALADAIGRVIADPALRNALGRAGALRAERELTMERYISRTLDVYEEALRQNPGWPSRNVTRNP